MHFVFANILNYI